MSRLANHGRRTGALACAVFAAGQLLGGLAMTAPRPREALIDGQPLTDFDARGVALPVAFSTLEPKC